MEFTASPLMRVSLICMALHWDKTRMNVGIAIYKDGKETWP
jgi:hypothetical protein